jgi:hypothetical protein
MSVPYVVQSVSLKRSKFTKDAALKWVRDHGYSARKIDVTPHLFRFRQVDPERVQGGRFRTIDLGEVGMLTIVYM